MRIEKLKMLNFFWLGVGYILSTNGGLQLPHYKGIDREETNSLQTFCLNGT